MRPLLTVLVVTCSIAAQTTICTTPDAPCDQWIGVVGWRTHDVDGQPVTKLKPLFDARKECVSH